MIAVEPGVSIHVEVDDYLWPWAQSVPVVMQHGFSRNASVWKRWVPYLAGQHRIYRTDFRGCGGSSVPPPGFEISAQQILDDVVKTLDGLGLERVHWVGESAGSLVGLVLAASYPQRVASLVLCDAPFKLNAWMKSAYAVGENKTSDAIRKIGVEAWCRQTLDHRLDQSKASPALSEWYVDQLAKTPDHVAAGLFDCFSTIDIEAALGTIVAPVLLLCGDKSRIATEQQQTLNALLPNSQLRTFEGYGHGINVLQPEACARAAAAFYDSIEAS